MKLLFIKLETPKETIDVSFDGGTTWTTHYVDIVKRDGIRFTEEDCSDFSLIKVKGRFATSADLEFVTVTDFATASSAEAVTLQGDQIIKGTKVFEGAVKFGKVNTSIGTSVSNSTFEKNADFQIGGGALSNTKGLTPDGFYVDTGVEATGKWRQRSGDWAVQINAGTTLYIPCNVPNLSRGDEFKYANITITLYNQGTNTFSNITSDMLETISGQTGKWFKFECLEDDYIRAISYTIYYSYIPIQINSSGYLYNYNGQSVYGALSIGQNYRDLPLTQTLTNYGSAYIYGLLKVYKGLTVTADSSSPALTTISSNGNALFVVKEDGIYFKNKKIQITFEE